MQLYQKMQDSEITWTTSTGGQKKQSDLDTSMFTKAPYGLINATL